MLELRGHEVTSLPLMLRVIKANGGNPPHTYRLFNQVVSTIGKPPRPVADPDFSHINVEIPNNFDERFAIPSVKELGE